MLAVGGNKQRQSVTNSSEINQKGSRCAAAGGRGNLAGSEENSQWTFQEKSGKIKRAAKPGDPAKWEKQSKGQSDSTREEVLEQTIMIRFDGNDQAQRPKEGQLGGGKRL